MAVPDFQSLMLPVLRALTDGSATPVAEVCARVAAAEGLTPDDLLERTRGGHTTRLKDRVSWSITHFLYAGLVERVHRAVYRIGSVYELYAWRVIAAAKQARGEVCGVSLMR